MSVCRATVLEGPIVHVLDEELHRERTLKSSIGSIDRFTGGFRSSRVTLIDCDCGYSDSLIHLLAIRAICDFDEEVVWVDGGNTIDPYSMSSLCKRVRANKRDVLSRINVSRAFTAYQLVNLLDEKLEKEVERCAASTVIVSAITDLFLDKDMKWMESYQLLRRCMEEISRIARARETVSVVTSHSSRRVLPDPRMAKLLLDLADSTVQIRARKKGVLFRSPKDGNEMTFSPAPWNQATLDEYWEV